MVAVASAEEYERLSMNLDARIREKREPKRRRKIADEALARVGVDQLLKDVVCPLTDGSNAHLEFVLDDDRSAGAGYSLAKASCHEDALLVS